jgi:YbbR domain-containing protein
MKFLEDYPACCGIIVIFLLALILWGCETESQKDAYNRLATKSLLDNSVTIEKDGHKYFVVFFDRSISVCHHPDCDCEEVAKP